MRPWRLATPLLTLFAAACVLDSSGLLLSDPDDDDPSTTSAGGFGGEVATTSATGGTSTTSTTSVGGQGGASTSGTGGDGGSGGTIVGWGHRQNITVQASTAEVPTGYSVYVDVPHQALVAGGQALASGNDFYVVHDAGTVEIIDRVVDPSSAWNQRTTRVWFETRAPIAAGASDDDYWIYYGNPVAAPPPADPEEVFLFFDDFTNAFSWVGEAIGSATGTVATMNGNLHIEGETGEIFFQDDSFYFARVMVNNGDVAVRAKVVNARGTLPGYAVLGGVMIRQSNNDSTRFILATPAGGDYLTTNDPPTYPANRASTYRLSFDNNAAEQTSNDPAGLFPVVVEAARAGTVGRSRYANDGLSFVQIGNAVTFSQWDSTSYLAGIAFANGGAGTGSVDVDWFLVRAYVDAEPTLVGGPIETGTFLLP